MDEILNTKAVVTLVFLVYAAVGGVLTIIEPETLSFQEYSERLVIFGGLVGLGRGIAAAGKKS